MKDQVITAHLHNAATELVTVAAAPVMQRPRTPFMSQESQADGRTRCLDFARLNDFAKGSGWRDDVVGTRARARGVLTGMFKGGRKPGHTVLGTSMPERTPLIFEKRMIERDRMLGFDTPARLL